MEVAGGGFPECRIHAAPRAPYVVGLAVAGGRWRAKPQSTPRARAAPRGIRARLEKGPGVGGAWGGVGAAWRDPQKCIAPRVVRARYARSPRGQGGARMTCADDVCE